MSTSRWIGTLLVAASVAAAGALQVVPGAAGQVLAGAGEGPALRVPAGFVVERVAGPPLIERPMMAGFDERGRLFVCDSSGFNLLKGTSDILVKDPPHSIRMLEDKDGDGRFDKSSLFADRMTFPMGAMWHDGALYVASAPSLWRLEDTDGDGVADRRQELVTKFQFGGNACDIHGPFLGPDGWIYWANCQRGFDIRRPDGTLLQGKAAGLFRMRADGSAAEIVCAGGMDNPVEVAFSAEGEAFATVNLFLGAPKPRMDAIIHCVEGGLFPYRALAPQFKRTGDLLPAMIDLGWVAPAGLMRYRSGAFGAEYRDNLFSAHFNRRRVQRHILERDGATFRGRSEDFLVSDDPDFHPTDVLEDADGSLLVIDTGGWFLRGCPTSQLAKPQIKGAIYRVRRQDAPKVSDPRGQALAWDRLAPAELTGLLDDPRWVVRDRAVDQLGRRGAGAVAALAGMDRHDTTAQARRNAVWALTRIEGPHARAAVRDALTDKDGSVRQTAAHSIGLHRDAEALERLMKVTSGDDMPAVRREAATALGRLGRAPSVPALLEAVRGGGDRFLEHAQIYALIAIADRAATVKGLADTSPRARRAALIALDQMDGGNLTREMVFPLLESDDAALQNTALTLVSARPDWADGVDRLLRRWLGARDLPDSRRDLLQTALLAFCKNPVIQQAVADALKEDSTSVSVRLLLLETLGQAPLEKLPAACLAELGRGLEHPEARVVGQAVATLRARGLTSLDEALLRLGRDRSRPAEIRVAALGAAAPQLGSLEATLFDYLRSQLDPKLPPLLRLAAADALGRVQLDGAQLIALTESLAAAGAMELPRLVAAFERAGDLIVGKQLVAALGKSPGVDSLSSAALRRALKNYPADVHQAAEPLFKRLDADMETHKTRLAELMPVLTGGDAKQGRSVFFGTRAACATCHAVGADGGKVGPDLSKIGSIRTGRDLLEALIFPSASFVRGYEPYIITTRDGRVYNGLLGRDTVEAIHVIQADRSEIRLSRSAIDEIQPGRTSIMPQGLDGQLSRQEMSDLLAYLLSLK